jgi:alkylation response protein AidB-like acyl-CoA dehydrogenase
MDFKPTEEQLMFRETVKEFAAKEVAPLVEEAEGTETFPRQVLAKAGELGLLAVALPEGSGGAGGDLMFMSILVEEVARECAGIALPIYACASIAWGLDRMGSEEQKRKYLKPILSGEAIAGLAITEPGAGSDVAAIRTTAIRDGESYILNGTKAFITNGPIADCVLVIANTDADRNPQGLRPFLVEKGTPGFTAGKKLSKLGLRSSETSELVFEDCRIPASARWGGRGGGRRAGVSAFAGLMQSIDRSRVFIASLAIGIAVAAFEAALEYAKRREQFGKPIGKFQAIQLKLVDMATRIEAARLLTYKAIELANEDVPYTKEASMAKLFATEACVKITGEAVQIYGGYGYCTDYPVERYFRDAKLMTIFEGTSEIQNVVIARELGL